MTPLETIIYEYQYQQLQQLDAFAWQQVEQTVEALEAIRLQVRPHLSAAQQRHLDRHLDRSVVQLVCAYYQWLSQAEQHLIRRRRYEQIASPSHPN